MKIVKKTNLLNESVKKLIEADEEAPKAEAGAEDVGVIEDPETASTSEIADEIKDTVEVATDGQETVSDKAAVEVAKEAEEISDKIAADTTIIAEPFKLEKKEREQTYILNNRITRYLNRAWREAKRGQTDEFGEESYAYPNVLIVGLPGSGKTAIVNNWARSVGANLVFLDAKNDDLKAMINGYVIQDPDRKLTVTKAASGALDDLEKPNSILFLDEFNRQTNQAIRGSVLSLIQDHTILGRNNEPIKFPNFLFTIVCTNPIARTDKGASPFFGAELNRFKHQLFDEDSDPKVTEEYFEARWAKGPNSVVKRIIDYVNKKYNGKFTDEAIAGIELALRRYDLGKFILNHDDFKYDNFDEYEEATAEQRNLFSQRQLTTEIEGLDGRIKNSDGSWTFDAQAMVDDFLDDLATNNGKRSTANLLDTTTDMLITILNDYNIPSRDYLFSHSNYPEVKNLIDLSSGGNNNAGGNNNNAPETTGPDAEENESDWNNKTPKKQSAQNDDWDETTLDNSINQWFN